MENKADPQMVVDELHALMLLPAPTSISYEELLKWLSERVNTLLKNDFNALIYLLYRMDVSEEKLRYLLATNKGEMAGVIIAELMIERQAQKIETRRLFTRPDEGCEEEKW